jgi:hypothetical protein
MLDDGDDVLVGQGHRAGELVAADAAVELHAADGGQVVAVFAEEQAVEQRLDGVLGRRLAGAHHPVDRDLGAYWSGVSSTRSVCEMYGPLVEVVRVDRLDLLDAGVGSFLSRSSVTSSLALATTSPVSLSTTFFASVRPSR